MGPTGGRRGYSAITGHVGWGISWYINGLLIPEINVVRGKTYTFVVEGGLDPETPARFHPFYITDDPVGGYEHKTPEERAAVRVFAGVSRTRSGEFVPTGTGRLCNWTPDPDQPPADEFASFGAYQRTLTLNCDEGEPGFVQWTPGPDTPDTVYYQCYTHRYLGWKINVLDRCDTSTSASEPQPSFVSPDSSFHDHMMDEESDDDDDELESRPSIRVSTRVRPNGVFHSFDKGTSLYKENDFEEHLNGNQQNISSYVYSTIVKDQPGNKYIHNAFDDSTSHSEQNFEGTSPDNLKVTEEIKDNNPSAQQFLENLHYQQESEKVENGLINNKTEQKQHLKTTYNSDPMVLNPVDPKRKPIVHATTPYSVLPTSNDYTESSTHLPLKSQDSLQELTQELQASNTEVQNSESKFPSAIISNTRGQSTGEQESPKLPHSSSLVVSQTHPKTSTTVLYPQAMNHRPQQFMQPFRRPVPHRGFPYLSRPVFPPMHRNPHISSAMPQNYLTGAKKPFHRPPNTGSYRPLVSPSPYQRPLTLYPSNLKSQSMILFQRQSTLPHRTVQHMTIPVNMKLDDITKTPSTTVSSVTSEVLSSASQSSNSSLQSKDDGEIKTQGASTSTKVQTGEESSVLLPAAINTGFHPESVIVEGGFKPIIHKKVAEDRSSADSGVPKEETNEDLKHSEISDRLEEELISDLLSESSEENKKENPFAGQQPELFEPMFVPSPPDRIISYNNSSSIHFKKPVSLPEDLVPPVATIHHRNSGQPPLRNPNHQYVIRTRPNTVRRPQYSTSNASPFRVSMRGNGASLRYQQKSEEPQDETPMAAERMDTYYLPPVEYKSDSPRNHKLNVPPTVDATIPPGTVVTYDGKSVADVSLVSSISNPAASTSSNYQNPSGTAALIRETPQFGPFRGEIPPPVPEVVHTENIPQLRVQNQKRAQTLPLHFSQAHSSYNQQSNNVPHSFSTKSTQLSLVRQAESKIDDSLDLLSEASDVDEHVLPTKTGRGKATKKTAATVTQNLHELTNHTGEDFIGDKQNSPTFENVEKNAYTEKESRLLEDSEAIINRDKRSAFPHHEPGHDDNAETKMNHTHLEDKSISSKEKMGNNSCSLNNAFNTWLVIHVAIFIRYL